MFNNVISIINKHLVILNEMVFAEYQGEPPEDQLYEFVKAPYHLLYAFELNLTKA